MNNPYACNLVCEKSLLELTTTEPITTYIDTTEP